MQPIRHAGPLALLALFSAHALHADAPDLLLTENGQARLPVIVTADPSGEALTAAKTLVTLIEKSSGAKLELLETAPDPLPESAVWVGLHPRLKELMPGLPQAFEQPEEILIACDGRHLAIAGRDRTVAEQQVEFGTANAVYTFLQRDLGVRWLRPWDRDGVWTDLLPRATIAVPAALYRFHPPFRQRLFWPSRGDWDLVQRLKLGSYQFNGGHAFTKWWEQYHEAHPDWFAQQPNGTRSVPKWGGKEAPFAVKLCVSNPGIGPQWLDNAAARFQADPTLLSVSASPNDGGGFCACEACRAWDHPEGPFAGADRYVKFWNLLARGLRDRLPERDAWVGAYAYATYKNPPLAEILEPNIAIGYVGHFPLANDEVTEREKNAWLGWADKASAMIFRPNLFHYSGGFLGLPCVAMRRTMRDFRFLADNKCIGLQVDSLPNNFNAQGVQYYLMAQLAYDPYQDGEALLKDYYHRAFGPAAEPIAAYYDRMEEAHEAIINWKGFRHSSGNGPELVETCRQVYTPELLAAGEGWMREAEARVADAPERFRPRVEAIRKGFEFLKLQVEIMQVMKQVREGKGPEKQAAVERAHALCKERDARIKAGDGRFPERFQERVRDYLGPPSDDLAAAVDATATNFLPAQWKEAWRDDFDRADLGPDWTVLEGDWTLQDGVLVTTGGSILASRRFPGLQRLEFTASATLNPGFSDLSPILQCGPLGRSSGYLLQCGGYNNTRNSIQRQSAVRAENRTFRIEPGRRYTFVAEYDGEAVRLGLDGQTLLEYADPQPLVGEAHEQLGFFVHAGRVTIDQVRVLTSAAIEQN